VAALQEGHEDIHGQPGLPDDCAQRPAIQYLVSRNRDLGERIVAPENHVAPGLPHEPEACFRESPNGLVA